MAAKKPWNKPHILFIFFTVFLLILLVNTSLRSAAQEVATEPAGAETDTLNPSSSETATSTYTPEIIALTLTPLEMRATDTPSPTFTFAETSETVENPTATIGNNPTVTAVATEPPFLPLSMTTFDDNTSGLWSVGLGWTYISSDTGLSLQATGAVSPVIYPESLYNVALQSHVQLLGGIWSMTVRDAVNGGYTVELESGGQVRLYRAGQLFASANVGGNVSAQWRTVRLSVLNDFVRVSVDGIDTLSFQDLAPLPAGSLSFLGIFSPPDSGMNDGIQAVAVDNVSVSIPAAEWTASPTAVIVATLSPTVYPSATVTPSPTNEPQPVATSEATAEVTATLTTVPFPTEPPLVLLLEDRFDTPDDPFWNLNGAWAFVPNDPGMALATNQNDIPASFVYDNLTNIVIQVRVQFVTGSVRLYARSTAEGYYVLSVSTTGNIVLYRGTVQLYTGFVTLSADTWQTIRLSVIEDVIRIAVNGIEVAVLRDVSPLPPGSIGFSAADMVDTPLMVDDFAIWLPAEELGITATSTFTPTPALVTEEPTPSLPQLPLLVSDTFNSGDLSAWEVGTGWSLVQRTDIVESVPENTPESTALLQATPETTLEAISSTTDFVISGITPADSLRLRFAPLQDMIIEADVNMQSGAAEVALRRTEAGSYRVVLLADGRIDLFRNATVVATTQVDGTITGWQRVRVGAIEGTIQIWINEEVVIEFVDADPLPAGTIAFTTVLNEGANAVVWLDNFVLYGTALSTNILISAADSPLDIFYAETFDGATVPSLLQETNWRLGFSNGSMAAETRQASRLVLVTNQLADVVLEVSTSIIHGELLLYARSTVESSYRVLLKDEGQISVYRNNVLLATASTSAFVPWEYKKIRFSVIGDTLRVYINDIELLSAVDSMPLIEGSTAIEAQFPSSSNMSVVRLDSVTLFTPITQFTRQIVEIPEAAIDLSTIDLDHTDARTYFTNNPMICQPFTISFPTTTIVYTYWEDTVQNPTREDIYASILDGPYPLVDETMLVGRVGTAEAHPILSPDGTRLLFISDWHNNSATDGNGEYDVYLVDLREPDYCNNWIRLTPEAGNDLWPSWSPDGTRITFQSNRSGTWRIYVMDAFDLDVNGEGDNLYTLTNPAFFLFEYFPAWSPDGREIAFTGDRPDGKDIFIALAYNNLNTDPACVICSSGDDYQSAWSPDGQYLLYTADRLSSPNSPRSDIYLSHRNGLNLTFEGSSPSSAVSLTAYSDNTEVYNTAASWSPDETAIAFNSTDYDNNQLYKQRIHTIDLALSTGTSVISVTSAAAHNWQNNPLSMNRRLHIIVGARPSYLPHGLIGFRDVAPEASSFHELSGILGLPMPFSRLPYNIVQPGQPTDPLGVFQGTRQYGQGFGPSSFSWNNRQTTLYSATYRIHSGIDYGNSANSNTWDDRVIVSMCDGVVIEGNRFLLNGVTNTGGSAQPGRGVSVRCFVDSFASGRIDSDIDGLPNLSNIVVTYNHLLWGNIGQPPPHEIDCTLITNYIGCNGQYSLPKIGDVVLAGTPLGQTGGDPTYDHLHLSVFLARGFARANLNENAFHLNPILLLRTDIAAQHYFQTFFPVDPSDARRIVTDPLGVERDELNRWSGGGFSSIPNGNVDNNSFWSVQLTTPPGPDHVEWPLDHYPLVPSNDRNMVTDIVEFLSQRYTSNPYTPPNCTLSIDSNRQPARTIANCNLSDLNDDTSYVPPIPHPTSTP